MNKIVVSEILISEAVFSELFQARKTQPDPHKALNSKWIKVVNARAVINRYHKHLSEVS